MKLQGIFVAAATPFDYSGGLYKTKVEHNIDKWNRTSIAGYSFAGTAGEGPLLREEEKIALWGLAAKHAGEGKLLLADASAEGVEISVSLARRAADIGFHAVVCGVPHYYKTMMYGPASQQLYFRTVADRSPIPVLIENSPVYTGVDVLPETIGALSAHPNIAGVIETGTPPIRIPQIREAAEDGFQILTGSARALWESFEQGATAALLPLASAVPYACITLWEAFRSRETEAGRDWQVRVTKPSLLVTDIYGPAGLKHAMEISGYYGGPPRLPFCTPDSAAKTEIERAFRDLRG
jgi:4-hydroxy-2-oxoglutarate aldolase